MPDLPLTARHARSTVTGWQAFAGGWLVAGALLVLVGSGLATGEPWPALWIPGLFLLLPAAWFLRLMRRRFADPAPVIRISADAYHDRRLGAPIPWAEVRSLHRQRAGHRLLLLIDVDRPERFLGNAGLLKGPMLRANPAMGFPVLGSRLDGLDVAQTVLADAAEAAWTQRPTPAGP